MRLPVYHVDAFARRAFEGNPASVVILEDWLPDALMQAIAAENNLSETAFVVPNGGNFGLRWFTPRVEVPLCGHATLATAYALRLSGKTSASAQTFDTKSGVLRVSEDAGVFTLDFPSAPCTPDNTLRRDLSRLLGEPVAEVHVARDRYLCVFQSVAVLRAVQPDMKGIAALPLPGLIITGEGEVPFDFTSRYFAPAKGVAEDPVTGASHCVLAPFWASRLGRTRLRALQASERGGQIDCRVEGDRVHLGGRAHLYMRGYIEIDL